MNLEELVKILNDKKQVSFLIKNAFVVGIKKNIGTVGGGALPVKAKITIDAGGYETIYELTAHHFGIVNVPS